MEKSIVEQYRESYPMTFYPDSLSKMLDLANGVEEQNNPIFCLEPISLTIKNVYYYDYLGSRQFYSGGITIFLLVISIASILLASKVLTITLLILSVISFWCYCGLQKSKNNLKRELIAIEKKLLSKQYKIEDKSSSNARTKLSSLLLNSLAERESLYNFEIDDSANKGLSESYFLSYLQKWLDYPWRIIEHCQFQGERYTPTADFILINDNLKLGIDLEIDEPYTLKESMPIHLVEDRKYIIRDKFFLGLGYIVIRFAEYQVVKYPDYCCLHIVRVLNQFLDPDLKIHIPDGIEIQALKPQDWRVKSWTQRESQIMAKNKIRDSYLEPVRSFNKNRE